MKCPKCGYNSFEYHDVCKKCSADFIAYKQTYNITPIVLPPEARVEMTDEFRNASYEDEPSVENVETHDDMFSFAPTEEAAPSHPFHTSPAPSTDLQDSDPFNFDNDDQPDVAPPQTSPDVLQDDDPFSFDDDPSEVAPPEPSSVVLQNDDPFSFESDALPEVSPPQSKVDDGDFFELPELPPQTDADPFASLAPPAPPAEPDAQTSDSGDFDLENFSWDDTPAVASANEGQPINDDFDSLFGDTGGGAKK
jgi:predicted  nucleic acid-binding Zn-ribbon protein